LLVEMEAFEKMLKEGSITAKDLAALVGIDESAIGWTTPCFKQDISTKGQGKYSQTLETG
jgi:hypothetical protein